MEPRKVRVREENSIADRGRSGESAATRNSAKFSRQILIHSLIHYSVISFIHSLTINFKMVQITFTTSLIAAVVACAYFADATPVATFGKEIESSQGFLEEESGLYSGEIKPFEYEPYGNKHNDDKRFQAQPFFGKENEFRNNEFRGSEFRNNELRNNEFEFQNRGFENGEFRNKDFGSNEFGDFNNGEFHNRGEFHNGEFRNGEFRNGDFRNYHNNQRPNKYFQNTEIDKNSRTNRFDEEREAEDRRELQKEFDLSAHSDRLYDNRADAEARREEDVAVADVAREDRKFKEQYDTEFDKSAYELGYGYDKGIKYDKGYGYSKGYNQEFEKQFDQAAREDAEADQFRNVQLGYENFRETEVKDRDEKDREERLRIQKERENLRDERLRDDTDEDEFRFRNRKYVQEQPKAYSYRNGQYFEDFIPRV